MSRVAAGIFVVAIAMLGCQTLYEELPAQPTQLAGQPRAEPTPTPTLITLPVQVVPAPTPAPSSPPPASPTPQPTPQPNPQPTPEPTPEPSPSQGCGGIQITIDASCAGTTPDCGINRSSKSPVLVAGTSVVLDASYFAGSERNKVHSHDPCYPGPIESWTQIAGGSIDCGRPFSNNHVMKCGPFNNGGSFGFRACGQGICSSITVTVR